MFDKSFFNVFGSFIPDQRKFGYYRRTDVDSTASTLAVNFKIGRRRSATEDDAKLHAITITANTAIISLWDSGEGIIPQVQDVVQDSLDNSRWIITSVRTKIAGNLFSIAAEKEV